MGSWRTRFAAAMVAVVVVAGGGASGARAADGDLFVDGCASTAAVVGCPAGLASGPVGVANSPDGNQVYAGIGAAGSSQLQIFDVNPVTGAATARAGAGGCFSATNGPAACTKVSALDGLDVAYDVAVARDGQNVYMATLRGGAAELHPRGFQRRAELRQLRRERSGVHGVDRRSERRQRRREPGQSERVCAGNERARGAGPRSVDAAGRAEVRLRRVLQREQPAQLHRRGRLVGRGLEDRGVAGREPRLRAVLHPRGRHGLQSLVERAAHLPPGNVHQLERLQRRHAGALPDRDRRAGDELRGRHLAGRELGLRRRCQRSHGLSTEP